MRENERIENSFVLLVWMKTPKLIKGLYKKPFTYDQEGTRIVDKDNCWVLDIRGWGRIQHLYKTEKEAANVQDAFGMYVCDLLNMNYE